MLVQGGFTVATLDFPLASQGRFETCFYRPFRPTKRECCGGRLRLREISLDDSNGGWVLRLMVRPMSWDRAQTCQVLRCGFFGSG